jgi:AraC-like DNA-binding protein
MKNPSWQPMPEFYLPHPSLTGLISHIMILETRLSPSVGQVSPFPPTPQNSVHFYPRDPMFTQHAKGGIFYRSPDSIIVGPQVSKVNLKMGLHHIIVSVVFEPGALFRFLGIPMYELYDQAYDASLFWGTEIKDVNEQLAAAKSHLEMKQVVEAFFLKRTLLKPQHLPFNMAMKALLKSNGQVTMMQLASLSCLSLRQFERKSKEVNGYSPKFFARLIRFSKAYRMKEGQPDTSWSNVAYKAGYFDQMHMIRDFKVFTGITPEILIQELKHAPVLVQQSLKI